VRCRLGPPSVSEPLSRSARLLCNYQAKSQLIQPPLFAPQGRPIHPVKSTGSGTKSRHFAPEAASFLRVIPQLWSFTDVLRAALASIPCLC